MSLLALAALIPAAAVPALAGTQTSPAPTNAVARVSVPVGAGVLAPEYLADAEDRPVVCKYCGRTASSARMLAALGACPQSPSKRHVALRGPSPTERRVYICRWCGYKAATVRLLTSLPCSVNPNGKKHVPAS